MALGLGYNPQWKKSGAQLGPGDLCCLPEGVRPVGTGLAPAEGFKRPWSAFQTPVGSMWQPGPRGEASQPHFGFCLHGVKGLVHKDKDPSFDAPYPRQKPGMAVRVCIIPVLGTALGRIREGPGSSLVSWFSQNSKPQVH